MASKMGKPTRGEITEHVENDSERMHDKLEDLETAVEDTETVQNTLDALDLEGTSEGADEVQAAIEKAQDLANDIADREDTELDAVQDQAEQYEGEIRERSEASGSDLETISDAAGKLDRQETAAELQGAREAVASDIEFLKNQSEQARNAREETERLQQDHKGRARGSRH
jgi:hypothetical protein